MTQWQVNTMAREYSASPHDPTNPAYQAFVAETLRQYRRILDLGIRVLPVHGAPTKTSMELFRRIESGVLPVDVDGAPLLPDHPLAAMTEYGVSANVVFRAVHDFYGHFLSGMGFETVQGEIAAYDSHAKQYPDIAIPALRGETLGQLAWFYSTGDYVPVQSASTLA